jgi:TRAP-type C4-dicarboxylate transport system substrate-binding protein
MAHTGSKTTKNAAWSAVAALVCVIAAPRVEASERRVATLAPAGSAWMNILEDGAKKLETDTAGRIKVKYYPGGVQGDELDVVRKMKLKQLDGAALTVVGLALIYSGIRVLQLPFLYDSVEEVDYIRGKMWPYFQKKFQENGFALQYPGDVGWTHLYSNIPLDSLDDLGKIKMWAWADDPVVGAYYERLKINSVPLGVPEVLAALKTGRINGCYGSPLAAVALQWYTEVSHATSVRVAYGIGASVVRFEVWDSASAADKSIEDAVGGKMSKRLVGRIRKDNDRALKAMTKSGVKVVDTPEDIVAKFRAEAEKVWEQLAGDVYSKKELEMVLKYRAEFRAKQK